MLRPFLRSFALSLSLAVLFAGCDGSSGGGGGNPVNPADTGNGAIVQNPSATTLVGTWSLGTTGVLQILNFKSDGTYSETYCDSTQNPKWVRQSGTWTLVDSTLTTTVTYTSYGADTLHLAGAAMSQDPIVRKVSTSGALLVLTSGSGTTWVSLKYVAGTSGVLPAEVSVAAPTFSVPAGTYATSQSVALATSTAGATVLYSLDGSNPLTLYTGPISVTQTETVRAVALLNGAFSAISSATYTIQGSSSSTDHDPALVGNWLEVYYESPTSTGSDYAYYDSAMITFSADGTLKSRNHSLVIPPTGAPYAESPDSIMGTWSTSGNQLSLAYPSQSGVGGTGTYLVSGSRLYLTAPDGTRDTLNKN
jgi:hypothetical protein